MEVILPSAVGLASGCLAAIFSHFLIVKKIRKEAEQKLQFDLHGKQVVAYQKFWSILGPTSEYLGVGENEAIVINTANGYYLDKKNAKKFIDEVHAFFYSEHGLFISKALRSALFDSRDFLLEASEQNRDDQNDSIKISNTKAKKFFQSWHWVRTTARNDLGLRDVSFPNLVEKNSYKR